MIINQTTTVTFFLPEEWEKAEKFKKENPDYSEHIRSTMYRSFTKTEKAETIIRNTNNTDGAKYGENVDFN